MMVMYYSAVILVWGLAVVSGQAHQHGHGGNADGPVDVSSPPSVRAPAGEVVGAWLRTRRGRPLRAFRGLRYAESPGGERRFQPPVPITQYSGLVDGAADGPACPQPTFGDYYVDEDCLRLNVYTPPGNVSAGKLLPVVVFIHAGGFYSVSGRSDVAGPEYLLDRDLVLVTINYRLASLGFLSTGDSLAPGNNGFKDQVAALRWVRRNVRAFGGDPGLVTIAGYSAGAFSVMLHTVSPMSKGLFHRAVSMSGSPISQVELPTHQRHLAARQARLLACPDTGPDMMDCLRAKSAKDLGDSLLNMSEFGNDPILLWVPVIEPDLGQERFLTEHPLETVRRGAMHAVPYLLGQTQDEFFWLAFSVLANATLTSTMDREWERVAPISFQLPRGSRTAPARLREWYMPGRARLTNDSGTAAQLGKLYNDGVIGFGVHSLANALAVYSPEDTFYYEFGYIGNHSHYEDPVTKKPAGAAHHDDLIYLFSINASFPLIAADESRDSAMVDKMTAIIYNFARYGDPSPSADTPELTVPWPCMEPRTRAYMRVDDVLSVRARLYEDRFQRWEQLYREPHCDICTQHSHS